MSDLMLVEWAVGYCPFCGQWNHDLLPETFPQSEADALQEEPYE